MRVALTRLMLGVLFTAGATSISAAAPLTVSFAGAFSTHTTTIDNVPAGFEIGSINYGFTTTVDPAATVFQSINTGGVLTIGRSPLTPFVPHGSPSQALAGTPVSEFSIIHSHADPLAQPGRPDSAHIYFVSSVSGSVGGVTGTGFMRAEGYLDLPANLYGHPVDAELVAAVLDLAFRSNSDFIVASWITLDNSMTGSHTDEFYSGGAGRITALAGAAEVPEPASLMLLSGGLLGLAFVRRRRAGEFVERN